MCTRIGTIKIHVTFLSNRLNNQYASQLLYFTLLYFISFHYQPRPPQTYSFMIWVGRVYLINVKCPRHSGKIVPTSCACMMYHRVSPSNVSRLGWHPSNPDQARHPRTAKEEVKEVMNVTRNIPFQLFWLPTRLIYEREGRCRVKWDEKEE